jgi:Abortive infection C-terminus
VPAPGIPACRATGLRRNPDSAATAAYRPPPRPHPAPRHVFLSAPTSQHKRYRQTCPDGRFGPRLRPHRAHPLYRRAGGLLEASVDSGQRRGGDRSLVLGRAKELAESVARVVITERGQVAPAATDFPSLIDSAHGALKRQPGTDLSNDPELRNLVQAAMKIVKSVGTIRNSFGSGHGRAREPQVEQEMVDVTVAATMLWVRWALGRLAPLILGQPTSLISDLLDGVHFDKGNLAERLRAANIGDLDTSIQQKLGTAVGIRAMRDTFLVQIEGVQACASSDSLDEWPLHYRRGVVDGLFVDENGNVRTTRWAVELVPGVLGPTEDQAAELDRLIALLGSECLGAGDYSEDYALWSSISRLAGKFESAARPKWSKIANYSLRIRFDIEAAGLSDIDPLPTPDIDLGHAATGTLTGSVSTVLPWSRLFGVAWPHA